MSNTAINRVFLKTVNERKEQIAGHHDEETLNAIGELSLKGLHNMAAAETEEDRQAAFEQIALEDRTPVGKAAQNLAAVVAVQVFGHAEDHDQQYSDSTLG